MDINKAANQPTSTNTHAKQDRSPHIKEPLIYGTIVDKDSEFAIIQTPYGKFKLLHPYMHLKQNDTLQLFPKLVDGAFMVKIIPQNRLVIESYLVFMDKIEFESEELKNTLISMIARPQEKYQQSEKIDATLTQSSAASLTHAISIALGSNQLNKKLTKLHLSSPENKALLNEIFPDLSEEDFIGFLLRYIALVRTNKLADSMPSIPELSLIQDIYNISTKTNWSTVIAPIWISDTYITLSIFSKAEEHFEDDILSKRFYIELTHEIHGHMKLDCLYNTTHEKKALTISIQSEDNLNSQVQNNIKTVAETFANSNQININILFALLEVEHFSPLPIMLQEHCRESINNILA